MAVKEPDIKPKTPKPPSEPKTEPKRPKPNGVTAPAIPAPKIPPAIPPAARAFRFVRGSHVELGHALLASLETVAGGRLKVPIYDEGSLYKYDPQLGIWARVDETQAGKIVQGFDGQAIVGGRPPLLKLKESDIKGALQCARREVTVDGFFSDAPSGLVFKDTLVVVTPDGVVEKSPHNDASRARFAYDFDYTEAEPEKFLAAMRGMFQPDEDVEEKIRLIGEFAGACLLGGATKLQRWILLRGGGDDGKSTLIDMIRAAMPSGSTCSIKPEDLEDQYSRADLAGKLLNTVTEVKQRDILEAETLKAVTVGDEMRGRRIREAPIDFKPRAGHIFAANGYPKFSDSSHGFWRRPIVITFNRRFTNDPIREVGLSDRILRLERPAVVCWLVRQGAKALARGNYVEPKSHFAALQEWRGETDAVFEFTWECLVVTKQKIPNISNGWAPPTELYKAFLEWARQTGHREMSSTAFGRRLTELGYPDQNAGNGQRLRPLRLIRKNETKNTDGTSAAN